MYFWLCWVFAAVGLSLVVVWGPLAAAASLAVERGLQGWQPQQLQDTGSVMVPQPLSCSAARGIFRDQGSNLCLLHWQADSLPGSHKGSPENQFSFMF